MNGGLESVDEVAPVKARQPRLLATAAVLFLALGAWTIAQYEWNGKEGRGSHVDAMIALMHGSESHALQAVMQSSDYVVDIVQTLELVAAHGTKRRVAEARLGLDVIARCVDDKPLGDLGKATNGLQEPIPDRSCWDAVEVIDSLKALAAAPGSSQQAEATRALERIRRQLNN